MRIRPCFLVEKIEIRVQILVSSVFEAKCKFEIRSVNRKAVLMKKNNNLRYWKKFFDQVLC